MKKMSLLFFVASAAFISQVSYARSTPSAAACVRAGLGEKTPKRLWQGISPLVKQWELERRCKVLKWFEENQFGRTPIGKLDDQRFEKSAVVFEKSGIKINITLRLPEGASAENPVPVFLFMDHRGGNKAPDFLQEEYPSIPTNMITSRGYAYVRWNGNDVCPNVDVWSSLERWPLGIISYVETGDKNNLNISRKPNSWGTIGAWAWGNSRVMDWIETVPELDASRVAVVGHSRGGKTALWTAAQDERFAMVVSNGSGCGGARLGRKADSKTEKFKDILTNFPNWFCPAMRKWIGRDEEVECDADDLMRLVAPRLLYVASGSTDLWAGPKAEKAATDSARDLYKAYGLEERIGYHCHEGPHKLRSDDWEKFMDFADQHLKKPCQLDSEEIEKRIRAACKDGSRQVVLGRNCRSYDGVWRLARAILLPDDFTLILDGSRIELADRVQDNIIRNLFAAEGSCDTNRNIRILGRNGARLSGGKRNHYLPRRSGDPNGWRSVGILFLGVVGYEIGGFSMDETQCWAISQERCSGGKLHDIHFNSSNAMFNQDGIDLRKGCHDIVIENISGITGDDTVALTALRDPPGVTSPAGMQIGGNGYLGESDDIYNVTIRNISSMCSGGHSIVRLLCADGIKIYNVKIENVVETKNGNKKHSKSVIRIGDSHYSRMRPARLGEMFNINVKNVKSAGGAAVYVNGPISESIFESIEAEGNPEPVKVLSATKNVEFK
jgi:pimeloyl-ACP methyl ester carboxylesterase